ncbi:antizyme inhibitor 2-like [Ixodes scapularis]
MGRRVVGILFHVKSARHDPDTFTLAVKHAKTAFDIGTRLGFRMTVLSIGGGFLGGTRMQDSFLKVCEAIRSAIDIHFPPSEGLEIIAEPGQFLVTSAYSLVVKVLHKRKRSAKIGGVISDPTEIFINESNTNTISRYTLPRVGAKIHPVNPPFDRPLDVLTTVWGSSCHPGDCVIAGELLFDISIGEWLLIDNMGAYAVARASGFNGHGFPPVNYVSTSAKLSSVQGILDSTVMRGGYGQVEQAIKARQRRRTKADEKMYRIKQREYV